MQDLAVAIVQLVEEWTCNPKSEGLNKASTVPGTNGKSICKTWPVGVTQPVDNQFVILSLWVLLQPP